MTSDNEQVGKQVDEPIKASELTEDEEVIPSQSQENEIRNSTPANAGLKRRTTEKRNYTSVAASKPAQVPEHPWTQVKYKNRKLSSQQSTKLPANGEHQGRRILFPREISGRQMSEADLMLALNEAL